MTSYLFRKCTLTQLDKLFGLQQVFTSTVLDQWLTMGIVLPPKEKAALEDLQALLKLNTYGWNEHELSMQFIGPLWLFGFCRDLLKINKNCIRWIHEIKT